MCEVFQIFSRLLCKACLFQDLIERCKRAFQELLLEKADLFYQFRFGVDDDDGDGGDRGDRGDEGRPLLPVQVFMKIMNKDGSDNDNYEPYPYYPVDWPFQITGVYRA